MRLVKKAAQRKLSRRGFIQTTTVAAGSMVLGCSTPKPRRNNGSPTPQSTAHLPAGSTPAPLALPHFPDRLHAFIWRNWPLVPVDRMAAVADTTPAQIVQIAQEMGLSMRPRLTRDQQRRSYITIIRRNWHLLPDEQLLELVDWTPEQLAYTLREDDFLFVKLGSLKPRCEPLKYKPPDQFASASAREIARVIREEFPSGLNNADDPLFSFVTRLSKKPPSSSSRSTLHAPRSTLSPRFCSSYFTLYGDPLLDKGIDPYPDGYLARLAESGVDGVC